MFEGALLSLIAIEYGNLFIYTSPFRLQAISTVYKATKTLKYNTCSILVEEGNNAAVKI